MEKRTREPVISDDAGMIENFAKAIEDAIRKLPGERRHTTTDMQKWTLGHAISKSDPPSARSNVDRARRIAHERMGSYLGGTFTKTGKEGKTWVYVFKAGASP